MFFRLHKETLLQDLSLLGFLAAVFCEVLVILSGGQAIITENMVMFAVTFVAIILVSFSTDMAAFVVLGSQLILFCAYKVFFYYSASVDILPVSYAWLILPTISTIAIKYFCYWRDRLETENSMLRNQVEELVVIDPLTELYNLRSLYHDFPMHISYANRNKLPITLMIITLRYFDELNKILKTSEMNMLKQKLAELTQDCTRAEDRLYSIDSEGSLAAVLTCNEEGAQVVRRRIKASAAKEDAFDGIVKGSIKVQVKIAFKQYNSETYSDLLTFKTEVENELQYDV